MRPCLFINDLRRGGAERLVKDLAIEMQRHDGVNPVVAVSTHPNEFESELVASGVDVVSLGVDVTTTSIPRATVELSRMLSERRVDVVHSHLPFAHVVSRLACSYRSIPHVSTYHNVRKHKGGKKRLAERATERLSDRIVCVSEGVRESYPAMERATVLYNAINVEAFNRRVQNADTAAIENGHHGKTVLLNVARCVEQKRQQDLINAIARVDTGDVHLYIVGDGPMRGHLQELVSKAGVSDRVTITGFVEAVVPYYAAADMFVSASSKEGLPTTHIEAMAAKLPIVSTDIPGVREVVRDGETGYLCPVNQPASIARAIEAVRANGVEMTGMGDRGFEVAVNEFSIAKVAENHLELYREVSDHGERRATVDRSKSYISDRSSK
jgi:L-malate glycosyltransferase